MLKAGMIIEITSQLALNPHAWGCGDQFLVEEVITRSALNNAYIVDIVPHNAKEIDYRLTEVVLFDNEYKINLFETFKRKMLIFS